MRRSLRNHPYFLSAVHGSLFQGLPVLSQKELDLIEVLFRLHPDLDHDAFCRTLFDKKRTLPAYSLFDDFPGEGIHVPPGLTAQGEFAFKASQAVIESLKQNKGRGGPPVG